MFKSHLSEWIHRKPLSHAGYSQRSKKIAYAFDNFSCQKSYFWTRVGIWKYWKSLPGPIKAFTAVSFQAPRRPSLSLLTLHGHHLRHLRRTFVYMSHKKPTAALLEPQGYWAESKSFSEEPPRGGYFCEFQLPAGSKDSPALPALPMNASRGALLSDSPFQGASRGF